MTHHEHHDRGTIAILAADGFDDLTLFTPLFRFQEAGYDVEVITSDGAPVAGDMGYGIEADEEAEEAQPGDYQALHIPAGVWSTDVLRSHESVLNLVAHFWDTDRPILAIGHGPQVLATADLVNGVELTSWPSIRTDLLNAGADWLDETTVTYQHLVTGQRPEDLGGFLRAAMKVLEEREGTEEGEGKGRREEAAPAR